MARPSRRPLGRVCSWGRIASVKWHQYINVWPTNMFITLKYLLVHWITTTVHESHKTNINGGWSSRLILSSKHNTLAKQLLSSTVPAGINIWRDFHTVRGQLVQDSISLAVVFAKFRQRFRQLYTADPRLISTVQDSTERYHYQNEKRTVGCY